MLAFLPFAFLLLPSGSAGLGRWWAIFIKLTQILR
jgi:hypothetical protein